MFQSVSGGHTLVCGSSPLGFRANCVPKESWGIHDASRFGTAHAFNGGASLSAETRMTATAKSLFDLNATDLMSAVTLTLPGGMPLRRAAEEFGAGRGPRRSRCG